ncbi:hypothetical protein BDQ17DRAFT_1332771 [Cyathus striatus]|nr:hypothetical protein BDQ17DRAFT_1332771 [Cyathus striatus]
MTEYEQDFWAERKGGIRMKGGVAEEAVEQGLKTVKAAGDTNHAWVVKSRQTKRSWVTVGYHFTSREEIEIYKLDKPIILDIPSPELRFQGSLISASNITFSYPHSATKCLEDVSLMIHSEDRAGLVGKNWEGKPTLVKLFTVICEMVPMKGSIEQHPRLRLGYFDQHYVGTEERRGLRWRVWTPQTYSCQSDRHPLRRAKVRPALAIVVYPAPNLLDEVTTHLDKDSIVALIQAYRSDSDGESDEGSDEDDDTGQSGKGTFYAVGPKGRVKLLSGGMDDCAVVIEKQLRKLGLPQGWADTHGTFTLAAFAGGNDSKAIALTSADVASTSAVSYFLDKLQSASPSINVDESVARACQGSFGLHGRTAVSPIGTLSGGQKWYTRHPTSLYLDEVTTNLDKDTIIGPIQALRKYTGAVLLVNMLYLTPWKMR